METRIRIFLQPTLILVALGIGVQLSAQPEVVTDVPENSTNFVTIGDLVYFRSGDELWRTDGTEAGTIFLESGFDVPSFFLEFNGAAYFANANNSELWKSDGTPEGTVRLHTSENNELFLLGISDNSLFFQAHDAATGLELYRTDGTAAGTIMLKDINPGAASSIRGPSGVIMGNQLIFSADNGTNGTELWRSDGTSAGTVMIKDINPGPEHSIHFDGSYRVYNDLFYFVSDCI